MMLDLPATESAADALIEGWQVLRPQLPADPLWRTLVRIHGGEADTGATLSPFVVGAYGHSRRDSVVRGFGEAIERSALVHRADRPLAAAPLTAPRLEAARADVALTAPGAATDGEWLLARSLCGAGEVAVPSALVDYPLPHRADIDPSPSGAAAGIGLTAARRSGLLEIVERDAFLTAWDLGAGMREIALEHLPETASAETATARAALHRLVGTIAALDARLVLAEVPNGIEGLLCVAAFVVDRGADGEVRAAVGCNAHDDPWAAALGAVQEALQLRSLQIDLCAERSPVRAGEVRDEQSRLARLASREGAADVVDWMRQIVPSTPRHAAVVPTADLLAAIDRDGGHPLAVDLTPRLPDRLQALGWAVVKIIPVGYQALRMDERAAWSWNAPRRARVAERLRAGGTAVTRPLGGGPPHPLP